MEKSEELREKELLAEEKEKINKLIDNEKVAFNLYGIREILEVLINNENAIRGTHTYVHDNYPNEYLCFACDKWENSCKLNKIKYDKCNESTKGTEINIDGKQVLSEGENHFKEKYRIINEAMKGTKIVISDPEGEYRKIAEMLGGDIEGSKVILNNGNSKSTIIDPFEIKDCSLLEIIDKGKSVGKDPYESLKEAGYIKNPIDDFYGKDR